MTRRQAKETVGTRPAQQPERAEVGPAKRVTRASCRRLVC